MDDCIAKVTADCSANPHKYSLFERFLQLLNPFWSSKLARIVQTGSYDRVHEVLCHGRMYAQNMSATRPYLDVVG